jgi:hypothetical protein
MKRLMSLVLILVIIALSIPSIPAANVDIAETGYQTPWVTKIYDSGGKITCNFALVPQVSRYRVYYRWVESNTGYDSSWKYVYTTRPLYGFYGTYNVDVTIPDYQIWSLSTDGMFTNQSYMPSSNYNSNLRLYITVRGVNDADNKFVTGFDRMVYMDLSTYEFAPVIELFPSSYATIYSPKFDFTDSAIKYYRVYQRKPNGDWKTIGEYRLNGDASDSYSGNGPGHHGRKITSVDKNWLNINTSWTDSDGDVCLAVRGLDKNGDWLTPFVKNYFYYGWSNIREVDRMSKSYRRSAFEGRVENLKNNYNYIYFV